MWIPDLLGYRADHYTPYKVRSKEEIGNQTAINGILRVTFDVRSTSVTSQRPQWLLMLTSRLRDAEVAQICASDFGQRRLEKRNPGRVRDRLLETPFPQG